MKAVRVERRHQQRKQRRQEQRVEQAGTLPEKVANIVHKAARPILPHRTTRQDLEGEHSRAEQQQEAGSRQRILQQAIEGISEWAASQDSGDQQTQQVFLPPPTLRSIQSDATAVAVACLSGLVPGE